MQPTVIALPLFAVLPRAVYYAPLVLALMVQASPQRLKGYVSP